MKRLALSIVLLSALFGCATTPSGQQAAEEVPTLKSIVVMPVDVVPPEQGQKRPVAEQEALDKGRILLDSLLAEYLAGKENVRFMSAAERDTLGSKSFARCRTSAAVTICQQVGGEAVLLVTLNRYRERQGNEYSVAHPASVAFDYKLLEAGSGRTLCAGVFDQTQQSLSENIFDFARFSKRGFKWITGEALAREGLEHRLANCPYLKK
ncbi:MAG: hypothetical protein ACOY8P_00560 [Thermodesulfobacteriota bacterium]